MEMAMEANDEMGSMMDRLAAAAGALEQAAERLAGVQVHASQEREALEREAALEERLREAEAMVVALKASAGRKTFAATGTVAKEGPSIDAGSLDAALVSLSLEQRIAVKAQLMRSGWNG